MRKIIAAINMTLDGFCDHTAIVPDEEIHQHYTDIISEGGVILYGRITFQLMEYWKTLVANPSGEKSMDDFAIAINNIPKIVFSNTLENTDWHTATLANQSIEQVALELRSQPGNDILVGSRSIIIQLMNLDLIDELQVCIHPVLAIDGLPLFDNISKRTIFNLEKTKTFKGGAVIMYYTPVK
jgi:dihydrofolate reductase